MTRWPLRIGGPSTRIHSRRRPYPRTRSKAVPKDLPTLPPIVGVAPYRLSRAVLAEQAKLSRQLKEGLASLPAAIDLRRMKDIEAERALIKHHEREAANHHQAAREAQARLAFLMWASRGWLLTRLSLRLLNHRLRITHLPKLRQRQSSVWRRPFTLAGPARLCTSWRLPPSTTRSPPKPSPPESRRQRSCATG
jgi:hypothetical protein